MQDAIQNSVGWSGAGFSPAAWPQLLTAGVLVMVRISSLMVFAPIFSSAAIAPRIKAGFVFAVTLLLAPVVMGLPGAAGHPALELNAASILGEMGVGLVFGFSLNILTETLMFAGHLLGLQFSFSLVNLLDPNAKVETSVLGQLLGWVGTLTLIGSGLDRSILAALMRSFVAAPVGQVMVTARTSAALASMAGGIFLAGVQLAAPVMAAGLAVEVTISLIGRLSPQLQVMNLSIPLKTMVSYAVLIGSLAVWPRYIEGRFTVLLEAAGRLVQAGHALA